MYNLQSKTLKKDIIETVSWNELLKLVIYLKTVYLSHGKNNKKKEFYSTFCVFAILAILDVIKMKSSCEHCLISGWDYWSKWEKKKRFIEHAQTECATLKQLIFFRFIQLVQQSFVYEFEYLLIICKVTFKLSLFGLLCILIYQVTSW